jgi:hypothetical protein
VLPDEEGRRGRREGRAIAPPECGFHWRKRRGPDHRASALVPSGDCKSYQDPPGCELLRVHSFLDRGRPRRERVEWLAVEPALALQIMQHEARASHDEDRFKEGARGNPTLAAKRWPRAFKPGNTQGKATLSPRFGRRDVVVSEKQKRPRWGARPIPRKHCPDS